MSPLGSPLVNWSKVKFGQPCSGLCQGHLDFRAHCNLVRSRFGLHIPEFNLGTQLTYKHECTVDHIVSTLHNIRIIYAIQILYPLKIHPNPKSLCPPSDPSQLKLQLVRASSTTRSGSGLILSGFICVRLVVRLHTIRVELIPARMKISAAT